MKSCFTNSQCFKDISLFVLRLAVGVIFVKYGWDKLSNIPGTVEMFGDVFGMPAPTFFAWLVGLVEFVGGIALILGLWAVMAAKLLAIVMIVALVVVHIGHEEGILNQMGQLSIALLGGSMGVIGGGAGKWKLSKEDCPSCCGKK